MLQWAYAWAAQDTGVEDGEAPGQTALWSAGRPKDEVGLNWGGEDGMDPPARPQRQEGDQEGWDISGSAGEVEGGDAQGQDRQQRLGEICDEGDAGKEWGLNGGGIFVPAH